MGSGLSRPLTGRTAHLALDMQNIFAPDGLWATPWMPKVIPVIAQIAGRHAERTVFTRFLTPSDPSQVPGVWQDYYVHWNGALRPNLAARALDLVPELKRYVPPARVVEKMHYSAFVRSELTTTLSTLSTNALVITGAETDVCVLATVLHAVDLGYRIVVVRDGVCSSSDERHDALMKVFHGRYAHQIETADSDEVLSSWPAR